MAAHFVMPKIFSKSYVIYYDQNLLVIYNYSSSKLKWEKEDVSVWSLEWKQITKRKNIYYFLMFNVHSWGKPSVRFCNVVRFSVIYVILENGLLIH